MAERRLVFDSESLTHKIEVDKELFDIPNPFEGEKYQAWLNKLVNLRKDGEYKVAALKNEIRDIYLNKQIDKATKKELISSNRLALRKAKKVKRKNKAQVKAIIKEADMATKGEFTPYFNKLKVAEKQEILRANQEFNESIVVYEQEKNRRVKVITDNYKDRKERKVELQGNIIGYNARVSELRNDRRDVIENAHNQKYGAFMNKYNFNAKLRNDKHTISEWFNFKFQHYINNFNLSSWLLKNALFLVVLVIFIALIILAAVQGNNILTGPNILSALVQIAPKIFFALGVGGLILLGGTDLSLGRLTGVGVSFSLMILSNNIYADNNGVVWFNFTGAAPVVKVIMAILISILFCTFFTTFAGFFTAKFKMHPFISTLAVQLISFGLFQLFWSSTSAFLPDENIKNALIGPNGVLLIVYAIVAILVVWFIWNKTKFGKHLYAVGGNQEAATVSGINPFTITLLAFVMAGVLYGLGGFIQGLQVGTGNFNSGYGTETDAIAACVIGGISFSGGVGKVGGAVFGAIILGFLTYIFNFLGVNANLQLLVKGFIILIAVALDCAKFLKKK